MISPVQSQEHVGGKSHLVLKKRSKYIGKCWQENLVKGVHHEQGDVEEDKCWVAIENRRPVLQLHNQFWQSCEINHVYIIDGCYTVGL